MSKWLMVVLLSLTSLVVAAKTPVIVVLGDSISAAYGIKEEQGWVALLQTQLKQAHLDYQLSNQSISGETTAGGLARLEGILTEQKPAVVLVELGANDGLRGLSPVEMKNNLLQLLTRSQQAGAKVLLLGMKIPPNYGKHYLELFYNIFPQVATTLNVPLLPFLLEDVALKPELMQADGLHPNAQAQPSIANKVAAFLFPFLR